MILVGTWSGNRDTQGHTVQHNRPRHQHSRVAPSRASDKKINGQPALSKGFSAQVDAADAVGHAVDVGRDLLGGLASVGILGHLGVVRVRVGVGVGVGFGLGLE